MRVGELIQRDEQYREAASHEASSEKDRSPEMLMVKEDVVEAVLQALDRGTSVLAVSRSYGLDAKTVRAWRTRGEHVARTGSVVTGQQLQCVDQCWIRMLRGFGSVRRKSDTMR